MRSVIVSLLVALRASLRSRAALQLEILALRHQLNVVNRSRPPRRRLTHADRMLWVWLSRVWNEWRAAVVIVKPETVLAWHRRGFRLFWTWKSRHRLGRPVIPLDVRLLIHRIAEANRLWGAPRIHGDLLKLGIDISQATVAKYMTRRRRPPSQIVDVYAAFLHGSHEWTMRLAFPSPVDRAYERYMGSSTTLNDVLAAGKGRVECLVLPHRYRHLSPMASLVRSNEKPVEKGERVGERPPVPSQPPAPPRASPPLTVAEELERNWYRIVGRS
jgi:hypothetical protein